MIASTGVKKSGIAFTLAVSLIVSLVSAGSQAQSSAAPAAGAISKLRILYAGHPGTDREKDFVGFLKKYFEVVRTGNLATFKEADTQGFDVTLLDWDINEFKGPRPQLAPNFSRPLMTLGVPGGLIAMQWGLKTGYL